MSTHRYPFEALTGDYIRAGAGILVCGGPLPFLTDNTAALVILGSLTVLFAFFGWRTFVRQRTTIDTDPDAIAASGLIQTRLQWRNLQQVKLSYFSTRRDRRDGWMQLNLGSAEGRLRIDSNIEDFEALVRRAHDAARANELELTTATLGNFQALGILNEPAEAGWGDPSSWSKQTRSN